MAGIVYEPAQTQPGDIARLVAQLGYTPIEADESMSSTNTELLLQLGVAAFCAGNVMLLQISLYLGMWSGDMAARYRELFEFFSLVMATPAALYSSLPFYQSAVQSLRHRQVSMDLPIAIAIIVMYVHGVAVTFGTGESFLDSMTMLVAFLLAGRFVEARGRVRASEAVESVLSLAPQWATLRRGDTVEVVPADTLMPGDKVVVGVGDGVAADGVVQEGRAELDCSHLTGEEEPVLVRSGSTVSSGSVVTSGHITMEVTEVGKNSTAGRIAELVQGALESQSEALRFADRLAPWFVTVVSLFAGLAFFGWYLVEGPNTALKVSVSLLVVACPCALSLAAPAAQVAGIAAAARRGAFVRNLVTLEAAADIQEVGVDKTGTVTSGELSIVDADDDVLAWAASAEAGSTHPIGRAIIAEARRRGLALQVAEETEEIIGRGIRSIVDGRPVDVVRGELNQVDVLVAGDAIGSITYEYSLRPDADRVLGELGAPVSLLSGDTEQAVERVAASTGISAWYARLTPEDKLRWVREAQAADKHVLFAGDGVNDAAAIAAADVGVAMGSGAQAGVRAADAVILSDSLSPVRALLTVAKEAKRTLKLNASFAVGYNLLAVVAAAAGFISPPVAAILMPISSAVVLGHARGLERRVLRALEA
jgi:Cu2+-exporting ATPase